MKTRPSYRTVPESERIDNSRFHEGDQLWSTAQLQLSSSIDFHIDVTGYTLSSKKLVAFVNFSD